jgi:hypothetical protein
VSARPGWTRPFLSRIAQYTPSESRSQVENLLTEWLAECLRSSRDFLSRFMQLYGCEAPESPAVMTQVFFKDQQGAGFFDLAIADKTGLRLVVELKWDDPLKLKQLARYTNHLSADSPQCVLGSLARGESFEAVPSALWPNVSSIASSSLTVEQPESAPSFLITDLRNFLMTNGMTEPSLDLKCLSSAVDFPTLLRFVHEAIELTAAALKKSGIENDFWSGQMPNSLYKQLQDNSRVTTYEKWDDFDVCYGVLLQPTKYYDDVSSPKRYADRFPWATAWIQLKPEKWSQHPDEIAALKTFSTKRADQGWHSQADSGKWRIAYRLQPLLAFQGAQDPQADLVEWFRDSISELHAGVGNLLYDSPEATDAQEAGP